MQISEIDAWVLSRIAYLDITPGDLLRNYRRGSLSVGELAQYYIAKPEELEQLKERFSDEEQFEALQRVVAEISEPDSKYYSWKIARVQDNNVSTGFVAYTVETGPQEAVVAFRGSEDMAKLEYRNDWQNNASSVYARQTVQQKDAEAYMADASMQQYEHISLTGHSLGGNLALYATLTAGPQLREAIVGTQTFNAPGFNQAFMQNHRIEIEAMRGRIQEFQNKYDLVSSIMFNPTKPIIIDTTSKTKTTVNVAENHALNFLEIENGQFQRSTVQEKDIGCQIVSDVTQRLQTLPSPVLEGTVDVIFAIWNGRLDAVDVAAVGMTMGAVALIGPMEAVAFVVDALTVVIVPELVKFVVVPALQKFGNVVHDNAIQLYEHVATFVQTTIAAAGRRVVAIRDTLSEFTSRAMQRVDDTVKGLIHGISNLWVGSNGAQAYGAIEASVAGLLSLAERLQQVQNRLSRIDNRLDVLCRLVDWEDKAPVVLLDWRIGYDSELKRCQDYVREAAERLEQCERTILQQAYAF